MAKLLVVCGHCGFKDFELIDKKSDPVIAKCMKCNAKVEIKTLGGKEND